MGVLDWDGVEMAVVLATVVVVAGGCSELMGVLGWDGVEMAVVLAADVVVGVRMEGEPVCVVDGVRMPEGGEGAVEVAMLIWVSAFLVDIDSDLEACERGVG